MSVGVTTDQKQKQTNHRLIKILLLNDYYHRFIPKFMKTYRISSTNTCWI